WPRDWSSDVCSSDLLALEQGRVDVEGACQHLDAGALRVHALGERRDLLLDVLARDVVGVQDAELGVVDLRRGVAASRLVLEDQRSEERRVGKGWGCG